MGRDGRAGRAARDYCLQCCVWDVFGNVRCVADCADAMSRGWGEERMGMRGREGGWKWKEGERVVGRGLGVLVRGGGLLW